MCRRQYCITSPLPYTAGYCPFFYRCIVTAEPRTLTILGSTGSIGTQTLDVVGSLPDNFRLAYLTTNKSIALLEEQVQKYKPAGVAICNEEAYQEFRRTTSFKGRILCGMDGVCEAAAAAENDVVMSALVGFSGVQPTLEAVRQGTTIALANKETLVSAGPVIMAEAGARNVPIIAVDSEHSAILQCLVGERYEDIEQLILTASGGPFRDTPAEQFANITVQQALRHPNWVMGSKITIDSATLMNKGFEVIEARWLFDIPIEKIDVVVHPQSIIHSMVRFVDGSVKAQLGLHDMRLPILYALSGPNRTVSQFERMDITKVGALTFFPPDTSRFRCLHLAFEAMKQGGSATAVLNAANEIAVARFLGEQLPFAHIPLAIEAALDKIPHVAHPSISDIVAVDHAAREFVSLYIAK